MAEDTTLSQFNFEVLISPSGYGEPEKITQTAAFSEVTGLQIDVATEALREGGYNHGVRQLVTKTTHPDLVLKRGLTSDEGFWEWVQRCLSGDYPLPYVSGEIRVYGANKNLANAAPPAIWHFEHGIATQVSAPNLDATASGQVPIEELHIAHENLTREIGHEQQ